MPSGGGKCQALHSKSGLYWCGLFRNLLQFVAYACYFTALLTGIQGYIKAQAREHPTFRHVCVSIAQSMHRLDMRLRLGLLQDQAASDRQIAREAEKALEKKQKSEIRTVKTEAQTKADEAAALKEKEKLSDKSRPSSLPKPRIRPLSEAKAIDSGATFISETFLFSVALSTIIFESWRQRRKEATRRGDVADKLKELEDKERAQEARLEELQHEIEVLRTGGASSSASSWFRSRPKHQPSVTAERNAKEALVPQQPLNGGERRENYTISTSKINTPSAVAG